MPRREPNVENEGLRVLLRALQTASFACLYGNAAIFAARIRTGRTCRMWVNYFAKPQQSQEGGRRRDSRKAWRSW